MQENPKELSNKGLDNIIKVSMFACMKPFEQDRNFREVLYELSFVALLFGASCSPKQDPGRFPWDELTEGDLAFRCGRGLFSRVVTATEDDGLYSHVGIVVREEGKWKIVHAVLRMW